MTENEDKNLLTLSMLADNSRLKFSEHGGKYNRRYFSRKVQIFCQPSCITLNISHKSLKIVPESQFRVFKKEGRSTANIYLPNSSCISFFCLFCLFFVSGGGLPLYPESFTVLHNDPPKNHCERCRIRTRDLCPKS